MNSKQFTLDFDNLKKAAPIPLIAAFVLGLSFLLDISFGSFRSLLLTATWTAAGVLYTHHVFKSGGRPYLINAAIHGAILAGVACLIYNIVSDIAISIRVEPWRVNIGGDLFHVIESAFIGLLAAMAWFAYRTNSEE